MTDVVGRLQGILAGRYTLDRELGRGGMATVYLAHDGVHDRPVAIKVLLPELSASLGADRFLREIELGRTLVHPHIIGMYESGEADGLLYYVMPFIEGESLRDRLDREQQLPIEDVVAITRQIAAALGHAHAQGVVHRDIKPENILLERTADGANRVVVADFGVARAVTAAGGETLTKTGMAVGTVVYMSPEQAAGSRDATPASDQYSLACVVYEMLSGQPPFTGSTAMSIMARHAMEQVPSLRIVRGAIPEEVEEAVLRALEKTPADRFATVEQFAQALTTPGAAGRPRARTGPLAARRPPVRRRRRAMLLSLAAVPALVAGWAGYHRWTGGTDLALAGAAARRVAVLYFDHPRADTTLGYLADGLSEDLMGELRAVPTLDVVSRNGVAPFRGRAVPVDSIARSLKVGAVVRGTVSRADGRIRVALALVSGLDGRTLGDAAVEQPIGDVLAMRDTLARRTAELIRRRLGQEITLRERRATTLNTDAWATAQRAELLRGRADSLGARGDTLGRRRLEDEADALYARAAQADARWVHPVVQRGWIAYGRARRLAADPLAAGQASDQGLDLADQALRRDLRDPDALELRGTLRYWRWLLGLGGDAGERRALLESAQTDLESSKRLNPNQAGAWATLSHLYNQTKTETDVKDAAQRAYEADAYLSNADAVLQRLFLASYDLDARADAVRYCDEGQRRFPSDPNFVECRLWVLTSKAVPPDVSRAWRLVDSLVALTPAAQREFKRLNAEMAVAAVLARAGLKDSARHVAQRARGNADLDPTRDLVMMQAFVSTLLGDRDAALKELKIYLAANPERRAALADDAGWWFRPLENDSGFQELVGTQS
ncbi:MAG TPA: serine/threonine-protein kinase [Gemmatimonadales bacterium]|nr:serine/threonine-protein kinase [Gemmatimonadales bacterium]